MSSMEVALISTGSVLLVVIVAVIIYFIKARCAKAAVKNVSADIPEDRTDLIQ
jgi:hypothetical protein